jgi:hypothetical protein
MTFIMVLAIYHNWIHPSIVLPFPPSPIPGIVSTYLIFSFTYICTYYFHRIHPITLKFSLEKNLNYWGVNIKLTL